MKENTAATIATIFTERYREQARANLDDFLMTWAQRLEASGFSPDQANQILESLRAEHLEEIEEYAASIFAFALRDRDAVH
jgi:hypothetical protein